MKRRAQDSGAVVQPTLLARPRRPPAPAATKAADNVNTIDRYGNTVQFNHPFVQVRPDGVATDG